MPSELTDIHTDLINISHVAQNLYNKLVAHQSQYQQAYLSERDKLANLIATYNSVVQENEGLRRMNSYCMEQLLPEYVRVFRLQEQQIRDWKAKSLERETRSSEGAEGHQKPVSSMEDQKYEEVKMDTEDAEAKRIWLSETSSQPNRLQPTRASKRQRRRDLNSGGNMQRKVRKGETANTGGKS